MQARPYQLAAKQAIQREWSAGNRRTLLVLPTGTGKTIVFSFISEDCVREGKRVLILAHRSELLDQAADKMRKATGLACSLEKADSSCIGEWERITVGSVQTLMREKRLAQFPRDYFDTIIVDEAHHCLADSYQRVLGHFDSANVLGVTATPDRGDMRNLGQYFDSLAYEYSLPAAIRDGYLCQIEAMTIPLTLDLTAVKTQSGDYQAASLGTALDPYLEQIAAEIAEHCKGRKTVVFLPLIATAQKFKGFLQDKGLTAAEVNGESKDRAEILADFDAGAYDVLCNAMLLTEGWDCPSVDCIVVLRATKIRSLYCQMVGRGTRPLPGKKLLLLDFLWHTNRHQLVHPAHLICEREEVAEKMTAMMADAAGGPMDIEEVKTAAEGAAIADREEALAKQLAEMRHKKRKLVDPLQFGMSIGAEDLVDYQPAFGWEMGPPSDKVVEALEKAGVYAGDIDCAGKASLLMDRINARRSAGLTTPKQIKLLEGKGFRHVGQWDFDAASRMITRIAACGWRVPAGVSPGDYQPEKARTETVF